VRERYDIIAPGAPPASLTIPLITERQFLSLSVEDQDLYLRLYREQVAPRFEEWRYPHRIKCAHGGRGAGAKSRSAGSLLIQFGENPGYFGKNIRVLCVRDVQKSIKESSWRLLQDEINRLGYSDWVVTREEIRNTKNGSYFVFSGLNDMTKDNLKSFESFDILFAEEGAPISKDAWLTLEATIRKPGSEIWILFNRDKARDPCYELYCEKPDPSSSIIDCRPGKLDNPWFDQTELPKQWARLKEIDPEEALHVFEGFPKTQRDKAVFGLADVMAMRDRVLTADDEAGAEEIGCDVARFGKDKTEAYKRKGMRVTDHRSVNGFDTMAVAGMLWDMAERNPLTPIKIDVGYNPGVVDVLISYGANVIPVGFGESASDKDTYANAAAEMMFQLPVHRISMPAEYLSNTLVEDLTERFYGYDANGRKKLEPKDDTSAGENSGRRNFKARHGGRSPDEGDALGLCFYEKRLDACY
jgi:hypothetical protein